MNKEEITKKPFYLIAKYWLGKLQGFIKISDNEEEITKLFEDEYMITKEHDFGVTEESYSLLKVSATELLDDLDEQSPYCEVCDHCGYLGCCGIRNFIDEHIEGKTNCKNEDLIISELIDLCEYKDEVFKQNQKYKEVFDKVRKRIDCMIQNEPSNSREYDYNLSKLEDILKEVE